MDVRIRHVLQRFHIEWQFGVLDSVLLAEHGFGDSHHVVGFVVKMSNDRQLERPVIFDKIYSPIFRNRHSSFQSEEAGDQLAEHHENQAAVNHENASAFPSELEADGVSGQEVDQQDAADQPAAG